MSVKLTQHENPTQQISKTHFSSLGEVG